MLRLIDRAKMRETVRPSLDQLGLGVAPDAPLAALSIAQRQLVEIAKALSLNARLLIMDEPTSSLTIVEAGRLHEVVASLRKRGAAVIYITHRLGEVATVADRAIALRDGANAGTLAHGELTHDNMISLMVGRQIDLARIRERTAGGSEHFSSRRAAYWRYPQHAVSFAVGRGEIVGMAGMVGAGRSEIALALFGVDPPIAGTVSLGEQPLQIETPADAIRHGIFLVPEDRRVAGLVVDFSIRENVSLPALGRYARHGLVSETEERRVVAAVCGQLQVRAQSMEVTAGTLSGGNQQKVVPAKWLALGPQVLVIDEPTRGIDVGAKAEIYRSLRGLTHEGVSILMISSDLEEILQISDRVAVLHEGRLAGIVARADCTEQLIMTLAVGQQL